VAGEHRENQVPVAVGVVIENQGFVIEKEHLLMLSEPGSRRDLVEFLVFSF